MISLNAPADFSDPRTGRSYRLFQEGFDGPWTPEDPKFDKLVGGDRTRDHVYLSQLSVNSDPGRSLKYAGSLLVVLGIAAVYFRKRGQGSEVGRIGNPSYSSGQEPAVGTQAKQPLAVSQIGPLLVTLATVLAGGSAAGAAPLDWERLGASSGAGSGASLPAGYVCPADGRSRLRVREPDAGAAGGRAGRAALPRRSAAPFRAAELLLAGSSRPRHGSKSRFCRPPTRRCGRASACRCRMRPGGDCCASRRTRPAAATPALPDCSSSSTA